MNINNSHLKGLIGVLTLFILILSVFFAVGIVNKIEEGKYIGEEYTIRVSDFGEVSLKPDLAQVSFSVVTEAKTVEKAMEENSGKMNAIIEAMKEEGIEEKDLKTVNFGIYPRYEWHERIPPNPGRRVLAGYEVRQTLQVKMRDMGRIGEIIELAVDKGANQVGNISFRVDDKDEFKKQAREEAIEKAKKKAKELAKELGVNLGEIVRFSESDSLPSYYRGELMTDIAGKGGEEAPQIETGENDIRVTVSITYRIR